MTQAIRGARDAPADKRRNIRRKRVRRYRNPLRGQRLQRNLQAYGGAARRGAYSVIAIEAGVPLTRADRGPMG